MKTIHPFPARMAPETLSEWIKGLPPGSTVLDPMCGSGVVIRQSLLAGHNAVGVDMDPLAVLMSRVWATHVDLAKAADHVREILSEFQRLRNSDVSLPWIDGCNETQDFIRYWFAPKQRRDLRRLSYILHRRPQDRTRSLNNLFWLSFSRMIVTKHAGASLAWDISHSRPHKVRTSNKYDVEAGFLRAVEIVVGILHTEVLPRNGRIYEDDSRRLVRVRRSSIDAIFSSPPYLNAIDYLRGHKFSLIWMGYSIPELRALRSITVGAERALDHNSVFSDEWMKICRALPNIEKLPNRQQRIIARYTDDATRLLRQFKRVLRSNGQMALVLGDSCIHGRYIENSKIYDCLATNIGFRKIDERRRKIETARRYLPIVSKNNSLENRMRYEVIQVYTA